MSDAGRLARLVTKHDGDVRAAVREHSGRTLAELARAMEVSRTVVSDVLGGSPGRRAPHIRRSIEMELGVPQYTLDPILDPILGQREEETT